MAHYDALCTVSSTHEVGGHQQEEGGIRNILFIIR